MRHARDGGVAEDQDRPRLLVILVGCPLLTHGKSYRLALILPFLALKIAAGRSRGGGPQGGPGENPVPTGGVAAHIGGTKPGGPTANLRGPAAPLPAVPGGPDTIPPGSRPSMVAGPDVTTGGP